MEIESNQLSLLLNPNWGNSQMGQSDPFKSALSSLVSSPADTSCYTTPLNSPPNRGNFPIPGNQFPPLANFPSDHGFADRAAKFSSLGGLNPHFGLQESEFLTSGNFWSNQSLKHAGSQLGMQENKNGFMGDVNLPEFDDSREESSGGEIGMKLGQSDDANHAKKRKSIPRGKAKKSSFSPATDAKVATESGESNPINKRRKLDGNEKDDGKSKAKEIENGKSAEEGNQKQSKENTNSQDPPKDYIHVRARRGQATDSHSLAERVRREKISERMKFLQDLVPGCNKVTGKAIMLDEIINYVQSLQRQVEFLSMKLSTVNPRMDFNMEAFLSKNMFQCRGSVPHGSYPLGTTSPSFSYEYQSPRNPSMKLPLIHGLGLEAAAASQHSTLWENDLQSVVQMGIGKNQAHNFHGMTATGKMKVEL